MNTKLTVTFVWAMWIADGNAQFTDAQWDQQLSGNSPNGPVWAIAVSGNDVYVGGQFSMVGQVAASNIARWDGSAWHALGSGVTGPGGGMVNAIAVHNDRVYVGGGFNSAGGSEANNIAYWNGSNWNWMRRGLNGEVRVLDLDASGKLYVGGGFNRTGLAFTQVATYVARWGSETWDDFSGEYGPVATLALGNGGLYAVGGGKYQRYDFSVSRPAWIDVTGGAGTPYISSDSYNVYETSALGVFKRTSPTQRTLLVTPNLSGANVATPDGAELYIGGSFTEVGGIEANHLAHWDGATWSALGSGLTGVTSPLVTAIATSPESVYVGGHFATAGGDSTPYFAVWNKALPPTIVRQPQRRSVAAGKSAVFEVSASGVLPLSYQWIFDGDDLDGETGAVLRVVDAQLENQGAYSVRVSNSGGTVESDLVELVVDENSGGLVNRALVLDGAGDSVEIANAPELQNSTGLTIEAWLRPSASAINQYGSFINKGDGIGATTARTYEFRWHPSEVLSTTLFFDHVEGWPDAAGLGFAMPVDTWSHMALTFDSLAGEVKVYIDGQIQATVTSLNGTPIQGRSVRQSSLPVVLGWTPRFENSYATGSMDDVRIWNYARSAIEIADQFSCKLTGAEPGLVGYWAFDDGGADDFSDGNSQGLLIGDAHTILVDAADMPLAGCGQSVFGYFDGEGGNFKTMLTGQIGEHIEIEATSDWETWTPSGSLPNNLGRQDINETIQPGLRVFRAKSE